MPIGAIAQVVQNLPVSDDPNLLIGAEHFSDAGVYRLDDGLAIVQSLDFFPPLVDDPYTFGRIAAANSLSDIFAVGAAPKTALNIVCFPDDKLDLSVLGEILRGGSERVAAAGAVLLGGHSVRDTEIKYGLSVTGVVDPEKMMSNNAAAAGDVLVLTKALGTGFITTANRAGKCSDEVIDAACESMLELNQSAAQAAVALGVRSATDITGFGLAGHAGELAQASDVTIVIELGKLPLLPGAEEAANAGHYTRANGTNRAHVQPFTQFEGPADSMLAEFVVDPQTSGGLLIAVAEDRAAQLVDQCHVAGLSATTIVGHVEARGDHHLVFRG